jgi:hypothetical protein
MEVNDKLGEKKKGLSGGLLFCSMMMMQHALA